VLIIWLLALVYAFLFRLEHDVGHVLSLPKPDTHIHVYVSLTTMPGRISSLKSVLDTLLNQTYPVTTIFIALPWYCVKDAREYVIPDFITDLYPRVQILRSNVDYGPATKVVTVVQKFKEWKMDDELVVVLDDDQLYPYRMVEQYVEWSQKLPDSVFTLRGHKMRDDFNWWDMATKGIVHSYEAYKKICVDIVTGVGSYVVRPRFFTDELWEGLYEQQNGRSNGKLRDDIRTADDIWISGQLAKNDVRRWVLPGRTTPVTPTTDMKEFIEGMIIRPWITRRAEPGNHMHLLGGGLVNHNVDLLQYFRDYWSCYGKMHTVVPCAQLQFEKYPQLGRCMCLNHDGNIQLGESAWEKYYGRT
jgi:hypothetical protein